MTKLEADYKKMLVNQARSKGAYGRRLEDRYGVGLLDVVIIPPLGLTYFIEAKRIANLSFGPTQRQFIEGDRILMTHGYAKPLLIGWDRDGVMHISPRWVAKVSKTECWHGHDHNYYDNLMEFINGASGNP